MFKKYCTNILLAIVLFLLPFFVFSQQEANTSLKGKQRAILIYNFAKQVGWNNINEINSFKIGVIGDDSVSRELKKIAEKRTIHGKRIIIKKISYKTSIKNISLLYVHEKFNYDIAYLLKKVSKKNTLIISENYKFNESMINIINTGENFQYELNKFNIKQEGFVISPSLLKNAIDSESKWQEFYLESGKFLILERNKVITQNKILKQKEEVLKKQTNINKRQFEQIKAQKEIIIEQFEDIDNKESKLEKLEVVKKNQNQLFKEKLVLLDSLEVFIEKQKKQFDLQKNDIVNQEDFLKKQLLQIEAQKKVLSQQKNELFQQKNELNVKKKQTLIAFIVAGLTGLVGFFIFRSNRLKKRLNKELTLKNVAIKQRTQALEAQNTEMEQFAYIASHDLKEPLNTISSFIQLIEEDYKHSMDEVGQQSVTYISEASVRMKVLIISLLEYSRLGKVRNLESVDCNAVFNNLQKDLHELISSSKAKLSTRNLPIVFANKIEMRLLFQNLITNAVKFIPENKTPVIQISCKKEKSILSDKEYWKFSISDNGIGIKKEHSDKIFAIFQKLHNIEEFNGTGIGLAHCKKIIKGLKGEIGVISEFGKGSTFWFTIPCQKPD